MKLKINSSLFVLLFLLIFQASTPFMLAAQVSNDRKLFKQYLAEFRKDPYNTALREKIIVLSVNIFPAVPTPKEYFTHLKNAKEKLTGTPSSDLNSAIIELKNAIAIAPWIPDAYFNISLLYEQYANSGGDFTDLQKAVSNYKYFLLTNPEAVIAKNVNEKIKYLQGEYDHSNKKQERKYAVKSGWIDEVKAGLLQGAGLNSIFKGSSLHISFRLGLNFPSVPMVANNNVGIYTTSTNYYGTGAYAGLEFWPLFGKHFGVGGFADGAYGISGNMSPSTSIYNYSNKLNYNYGLNTFLGFRPVKILLNHSITTTNFSATTFSAAEWDRPSSKIDFGSKKYGGGLRFNFKKSRKDLDLMMFFEKVDLVSAQQKNIQVYHLAYTESGRRLLQLNIAPNYPIVGNTIYPVDNQFKNTGLFVSFTVAHSFDFYGHRFRNQNW